MICRALIDSYISHVELVSVNNMLEEYDDIKEANKNLNTSINLLIKQCYCISWSVEKIKAKNRKDK